MATASSRPSSRHCPAMVPAVTATVRSPEISCAFATAARTPSVTKWKGASGWASTQSVGHLVGHHDHRHVHGVRAVPASGEVEQRPPAHQCAQPSTHRLQCSALVGVSGA